jgi:hypothetical protein
MTGRNRPKAEVQRFALNVSNVLEVAVHGLSFNLQSTPHVTDIRLQNL